MKKFFILILTILVLSNYFIIESAAKISVKKTDEIRCSFMYEKFKKMGEKNMLKRYPAYPIMDVCLRLYDNPNWTFGEKNFIDKKYSDLTYSRSIDNGLKNT